jgi:hypothetical protein
MRSVPLFPRSVSGLKESQVLSRVFAPGNWKRTLDSANGLATQTPVLCMGSELPLVALQMGLDLWSTVLGCNRRSPDPITTREKLRLPIPLYPLEGNPPFDEVDHKLKPAYETRTGAGGATRHG